MHLVCHNYHLRTYILHFLLSGYFRMTDEERNELEKQVKTLQESYNLFFSESLKQLQQLQTLGDIKVEEKVMLFIYNARLFQDSQSNCMVVEIYVNDKEMILSCVRGRNMGGVYVSTWRFPCWLLNATFHLLSSVSVTS